MKLIYIAGPFRPKTPGDCWEMECNIRRAEALALEVWRLGAVAICPHANTRFFQGALPDSVWLEGDLEILKRCDAILMLPGWEASYGACCEWDFALKNNVADFFDTEELREWLAEQEAQCPD